MIDQILAAQREATFDFREHAHPADPLAHHFEEWVPYYRLKFAIAKALRPASILEIGVRFGYSAHVRPGVERRIRPEDLERLLGGAERSPATPQASRRRVPC